MFRPSYSPGGICVRYQTRPVTGFDALGRTMFRASMFELRCALGPAAK